MFHTNRHIVFLVIILDLLLRGMEPVAAASEEDRIKALYLYNFLLFVDWPEDAIGDANTLRVAVIGDDTLYQSLSGMGKQQVKGKDLVIVQISAIEDLVPPCHVLFIGSSERSNAPGLLRKARNQPVLTVSDMAGFTEMGGMVYFKHLVCTENNASHQKRFEINLSAVEHAGLKIRSRLLRLSDIVNQP